MSDWKTHALGVYWQCAFAETRVTGDSTSAARLFLLHYMPFCVLIISFSSTSSSSRKTRAWRLADFPEFASRRSDQVFCFWSLFVILLSFCVYIHSASISLNTLTWRYMWHRAKSADIYYRERSLWLVKIVSNLLNDINIQRIMA